MTITGRYTRTAMTLHWLIALLIMTNVLIIWTVDSFPETFARPLIDTHKSIGITVLGLALLRVLWRIAHRPPALPASYPKWEKFAAHTAHAALYLVIFCLPLSGWAHDSAWNAASSHPMKLFFLIPWPRIGLIMALDPATKEHLHSLFGQIHGYFGYILYGLFALHVVGALKHQFLDREPELQRMVPFGKAPL